MISKSMLTVLAVITVSYSTVAFAINPFSTCSGSAVYKVKFINLLTPEIFGDLIPESGLVYSPLAGASHSNRFSFFTIRGYASRPVEILAEQGRNAPFIKLAKRIRAKTGYVGSVADAGAPTMPGKSTTLVLKVDCDRPFLTVLGMIAPSPDWIVQINNRNMFDADQADFIKSDSGTLIAYDTGVDDSREFTPPLDLSLDLPTVPQKNIAPLVEDDTDRFEGRIVGKFSIKRIRRFD